MIRAASARHVVTLMHVREARPDAGRGTRILSDTGTHLAERRTSRALTRPRARQVMNLSLAVAGTLGGAVLLSSNVAVLLVVRTGAIPWIPLGANLALVLGGLMFAREYLRGHHD